MDAKTAFSLVKLIQAGIKGESHIVGDYAHQISDQLAVGGDAETAECIRLVLNGRAAKKASIKRLAPPMPVDAESRLSIADETLPGEPVRIVLSSKTQKVVERFIDCIQNAHQLAAHGVSVPASMIMHGPPGCGKTLLAHHIAQRLGLPLLLARSDSLISSYLGSTAKNIRSLFEHAASRRCILFLDEFDALAKMRDDQHELGELKRVVISLLQNIDANGSEYILLAATNHAHLLDPAVWRRFSYVVEVRPPDTKARSAMLNDFLGNMASPSVADTLAAVTDGLSGGQLRDIVDDAIRHAVLDQKDQVDFGSTLQLAAERLDGGDSSIPALIRLLRARLGKSMSQTKLGEIFDLSQATVSRILKDEANG